MAEEGKQPETRWEALKEIMDNGKCREAIGQAWPLYFYAIFHGNQDNRLVTSFPTLAGKLGIPVPTIKRWKRQLVERGVLNSVQGSHEITLRLLSPYDAPLTRLKNDEVELIVKSDDATKRLLKKMFSSNSVSLLPLIAELAHKVEVLEKAGSKEPRP